MSAIIIPGRLDHAGYSSGSAQGRLALTWRAAPPEQPVES